MTVSNLKFTLDNVEYQWEGGYGAVISSIEKGRCLQVGSIRAIAGTIFRVFSINRKSLRKRRITWCPVEDIDHNWLDEFKEIIFIGHRPKPSTPRPAPVRLKPKSN